ncbi:hypothetical protein GPECTOR_11g300 [Gonium pectorale]|uniref:DM10 domain-containing protein n=1 Tax=Gonium pectorale TaxID=33097 RepID=A0A150GPY4_GONPE|nr:hypothetical protein GPECTOR_11g300 [Gonium pectorale]|eukprot:KXZ51864.1 hypothetical protein GPECTOR_11g300 [Gonium pectorale]
MDPLNRGYKWGGRVQDVGPVPPFALHEGAGAGAGVAPHQQQGQKLQPGQREQPREAFVEPGSSSRPGRVPNWVAYDRKVLCFGGYFREEVPAGVSPLESWRVRKVSMRYYLENDQVEIVELREENSGLPQGTLLKRHCAIKDGGTPLRWPDLRVGGSVTLYKRTYLLVSADAATRAFYAAQGAEQLPDEPFPEGPYDQKRKAANAGQHLSPRGPAAVFNFLPGRPPEHIERRDGATLRFLAAWDNTAVTFGEVLCFSLAYHVADGSIEVREVARPNSGRDPFPLLLSRCRLPKTVPPVDFNPNGPKRPPLSIPPHTSGFGSEEDSLQSCLRLVPRPAQRPPPEQYDETWNKALRFEAAMTALGPDRPLVVPHDADRRFIVSFHLLDRTLSVWEPRRPNSGLDGGTFLERNRVKNPATDKDYAETDLQASEGGEPGNTAAVGSVLEVFGRGFALLDADAYTLGYMETQPHRFPWADYDQVHSKLRAWLALYPEALPDRLKAELAAADNTGAGYIPKHKLYSLLSSLGSDLSPHEVVTLVRRLGADRGQGLLAEQLLVALGLAPPPPPPRDLEQEEALLRAAEARSQIPARPPVPFPAPGLHAASAAATATSGGQSAPVQRVAWAQQPSAPQGPSGPTPASAHPPGPSAAPSYRGIGPVPGHPRVEPPPFAAATGAAAAAMSPARPQYLSMQRTPEGGSSHGGSGDDVRGQRDTPTKAGGGVATGKGAPSSSTSFSSDLQSSLSAAALAVTAAAKARGSGGSLSSTGIKQPASLWQTTNMAFGGVGHSASFRQR